MFRYATDIKRGAEAIQAVPAAITIGNERQSSDLVHVRTKVCIRRPSEEVRQPGLVVVGRRVVRAVLDGLLVRVVVAPVRAVGVPVVGGR